MVSKVDFVAMAELRWRLQGGALQYINITQAGFTFTRFVVRGG